MPKTPGIPEADLARIALYCQSRSPDELADQLRVEHDVRGSSVTILECRAPWMPGTDWTRSGTAQLRFDPETSLWTLYSSDRNSRWHVYDFIDSTPRVEDLLAEIEDDPTSIFWG